MRREHAIKRPKAVELCRVTARIALDVKQGWQSRVKPTIEGCSSASLIQMQTEVQTIARSGGGKEGRQQQDAAERTEALSKGRAGAGVCWWSLR